MSSAQMIVLKSLSFLESSLLSQAWEKFPLPPSAAGGGAFSAGETVARWFSASQSPAAAVSRDFRRRQGAPKRAPHPFSQARLTHPHQPPSTLPGPPCLHSPRPDGFPGKSVLVRTPFQSHILPAQRQRSLNQGIPESLTL